MSTDLTTLVTSFVDFYCKIFYPRKNYSPSYKRGAGTPARPGQFARPVCLPDHPNTPNVTTMVSRFWRKLFKVLKVDIKLFSTFHPQTDGQTERVNQVLEQYLRCTINYQQDDWTTILPLVEFAYNNTIHSSTQHTLFFANYGYHPRLDTFDF